MTVIGWLELPRDALLLTIADLTDPVKKKTKSQKIQRKARSMYDFRCTNCSAGLSALLWQRTILLESTVPRESQHPSDSNTPPTLPPILKRSGSKFESPLETRLPEALLIK